MADSSKSCDGRDEHGLMSELSVETEKRDWVTDLLEREEEAELILRLQTQK